MEPQRTADINVMRHSLSHILATAVLRLYPGTKLGIGAVIPNGFYHDFQFSTPIKNEDLVKIKNEMNKVIAQEIPIKQVMIPKNQAIDILNLQGQIFKTEILATIQDPEVSFYKTGEEFIDLCRGPHLDNTGKANAFEITQISGSYWNNDKTRPLMQRIHGIAFTTQSELDEYIKIQNEKKLKDHKKIALALDLFTLDPQNGSGLLLWLPKGEAIRTIIKNYIQRQNKKLGYLYVDTPTISKTYSFRKSKVQMSEKNYCITPFKIENDDYLLKPRCTEHHIQIFKSKSRSYKELPFKISELSKCFRNGNSGDFSGFYRVREFLLDANTVLCEKKQITNVVTESIILTKKIYQDFGLHNYKIELALKGPNHEEYFGDPKEWMQAQTYLVDAIKKAGVSVQESQNSAKKAGPGINFLFEDVFQRLWQLGTIQIDMEATKNHTLKYTDAKNKEKKPYLINRTAIGSLERFFAVLIENTEGNFPVWLSPIQINIIPISDKYVEYAYQIYNQIIEHNINVSIDTSQETMQNKIRQSQIRMIPYMLIIGEKEQNNDVISVRPRSGQDLGMMKLDDFLTKIEKEIEEKVNF